MIYVFPIGCVSILILAIGYGVFAFRHSIDAENNTQAFRTMCRVLENYVADTDRCPESREDLFNYSKEVNGRWSNFDWPENAESILDRVEINYSMTLEEMKRTSMQVEPVDHAKTTLLRRDHRQRIQ